MKKYTIFFMACLMVAFCSGCKSESVDITENKQQIDAQVEKQEETESEQSTEEPKETQNEDSIDVVISGADTLQGYRTMLEEALAIEGQPAELADLSMDYATNQELFNKHYDMYALYDLDNDEIPELIASSIVNQRWIPISIFTMKDNQVVLLKDPVNTVDYATFDQCSVANGSYITYICEAGHIHSIWRGTTPTGDEAEEDYAYSFKDGELVQVECNIGECENNIYFYDIAKKNSIENLDEDF